jgi:hypothetical protein
MGIFAPALTNMKTGHFPETHSSRKLELEQRFIAESPNLPDLIATPPFQSRLTSDGVASTH